MALPEKEWFTLEEIAQRWGCSVEDLWHYADTGRLRLSVIFNLPIPIKWNGDPQQTADYQMTSGPLGLPAFTAREILNGNAEDIALFLPPVIGKDDVYGFSALNDPKCPASLKLNTVRPIDGRGPFIVRAERDRFEQEYRIGAAAGRMPSERELEAIDPRERASLLRIIAALAAHAELPPQPHKAAAVIASIAARHGIELPSEKTIAAKIDEARKAADS